MVENGGAVKLPPIGWLDDIANELKQYKLLAERTAEQNTKVLDLYFAMQAQVDFMVDTTRTILEVVSFPKATAVETKVAELANQILNYDTLDWRDL